MFINLINRLSKLISVFYSFFTYPKSINFHFHCKCFFTMALIRLQCFLTVSIFTFKVEQFGFSIFFKLSVGKHLISCLKMSSCRISLISLDSCNHCACSSNLPLAALLLDCSSHYYWIWKKSCSDQFQSDQLKKFFSFGMIVTLLTFNCCQVYWFLFLQKLVRAFLFWWNPLECVY